MSQSLNIRLCIATLQETSKPLDLADLIKFTDFEVEIVGKIEV